MITCTLCHRELPETDFYPSALKKGQHHCKKCCYKHYLKKANQKYQKSLEELPDILFDNLYGGYNIKVLNHARPNEYKYTISPTRGEVFKTNNLDAFMDKLWEELKQEK